MSEYKELFVPNGYYHVFNRAVGKEKIFIAEENYFYFLHLFDKYINPLADVFCYCLLPNHFHFFIRIKDLNAIQEQMKLLQYRHTDSEVKCPDFILQRFSNLFNAYTKALNKQQKRKGKLFMEPFNRKSVNTPEYYTKLVHYIHANPVHHGLCKTVDVWLHSSYNQILNKEGNWLRHEEIIKWFGSGTEYKKIHEQPIERKFAKS